MDNLTTLQKAVINQLGFDADELVNDGEAMEDVTTILSDVVNHGASGGFGGFTYYSDTRDFTINNLQLVLASVDSVASDELGMGCIEFIHSFNCIDKDDITIDDIAKVIYGKEFGSQKLYATIDSDESTQILNALAWYALEQVAFELN